VLLLDDDAPPRRNLERSLRALGHVVIGAGTGAEAVELLGRQDIQCVVADVLDAAAHGSDLLSRLLSADPQIAVVVVTAHPDLEGAAQAILHGATDLLVHPVPAPLLSTTIKRAVDRRAAALAREAEHARNRDEVSRLHLELVALRSEGEQLSLGALSSLVYMMENAQRYLAGHSTRVAALSASMAAELGRGEDEVEIVRRAGRVHDVGMLCIGDGILSKQGRLAAEEFDQVKKHPIYGSEILGRLPNLDAVCRFVRGHHERWDGSGYPDGLVGEQLAWGARLLAAAEMYDALVSVRPYKEVCSPAEALKRMHALAGTALCPETCDVLERLVRSNRALVFLEERTPGVRLPA
jgi:response regulator RpfG family c-di-GMP phosphodiesterase